MDPPDIEVTYCRCVHRTGFILSTSLRVGDDNTLTYSSFSLCTPNVQIPSPIKRAFFPSIGILICMLLADTAFATSSPLDASMFVSSVYK